MLQIPCAKVQLAVVNGQCGSIGLRFPELANREIELVHGVDLLAANVIGYDRQREPRRQTGHTFRNILAAVSNVLPDGPQRENGLQVLASYLLLDALVVNTDRHHENWAFFRERRPDGVFTYRVAPSFDHASSLVRELTEEKLAAWARDRCQVERYVYKGRGGIFVDASATRAENPLKLAEIVTRKCPAFFANSLERLQIMDITYFEHVISKVPETLMSERAKRFCASILDFTRNKLSFDLMKTLFLAWQDEGTGVPDERPSRGWYPVGRLDQEESFYRFTYLAGARRAQLEANFGAFDAFPKLQERYESATLFPLFRMRVPDPSREDFGDFVSRLGLAPDDADPMDILAVSGGRRQTDHLEVFPKIQPRRDGRFRCRFFLHGWRHVSLPAQQRLIELRPGEPLRVALEMNNPATGRAVLLLTTDDYQTLGWAPRYLVQGMFAAIENAPGELAAEIVRINLPPAPANQRALIELRGQFLPDYQPMSSADFESLVPDDSEAAAEMSVAAVGL